MKVLTHLVFDGKAVEAMQLHVSLIPGLRVVSSTFYTEGESAGKLQQGRFESESDLRNCYERLSEGGSELMPLDNYGFSPLFGWLSDRFGVGWQLNLVG